jgi:hypothetical protein
MQAMTQHQLNPARNLNPCALPAMLSKQKTHFYACKTVEAFQLLKYQQLTLAKRTELQRM